MDGDAAAAGSGRQPEIMTWLGNTPLRNSIVRYGAITLAWGVGLSVILAIVAAIALLGSATYLFQSFLGSSGGSASSSGTNAGGLIAGAFMALVGFFFFESNLTPFGATVSVATSTLFGAGALTITAVVVQRAFVFGRRLAIAFPDETLSAAKLGSRSALIALPYWAGAIVLYFLGTYHLNNQSQALGAFGPSAIGLVAPALVVALPAAIGGAWGRRRALSPATQEVLRGATLGAIAIAAGAVLALVGMILAMILMVATSPSSNPLSLAQQGAAAASPSGGSASGGNPGLVVLVILAALVGIVFYFGNALVAVWGDSISLKFLFSPMGGWALIPLVLGLAGALMPALHLRRTPSHFERAAFAVTVGLGTALLSLLVNLTLGTYSSGPDFGPALLGGLVVGAGLAVVGPTAATMPSFAFLLANPFGAWVGHRVAASQLAFAPATVAPGTVGAGVESSAPAVGGEATAVHHTTSELPTLPAAVPFKLGRRTKIAAGVVVALVVLGIAGNVLASNATSPSAIATEYVHAVGQNNVDQVWQASTVIPTNPNPQSPGGQILQLDSKQDFVEMMKLPANRHSTRDNIHVDHLAALADSTVVSLSFREGGKQRSTSLVLQKSPEKRYLFFPDWRVVVTPSLLAWLPPAADAKILIDGTPASGQAALTLPGYHKLTLMGGGLFADSTQVVPAAQSLAEPVRFPLSLTAQATTAAGSAVKAYFTSCAARSSAGPSGCPQSVTDWTPINVHWTLVGDPNSDMQVDVEANSASLQTSRMPQVVAYGHYLMTVVFDGTGGTKHRFSGGEYALDLKWDGSKFAASEAQDFRHPSKPLARPSVNDEVVKSAVAKAFAACARIKAESGAPNCPMSFASFDVVTNPQWDLVGDQLQGATVGFDETTGVLTVAGSYKMKFTYSTESSPSQSVDKEDNYTAYVVWDGKNATAVYIR